MLRAPRARWNQLARARPRTSRTRRRRGRGPPSTPPGRGCRRLRAAAGVARPEALHLGAHPHERAATAVARLEVPGDDRPRARADLGGAGDARRCVELEQTRVRRPPQPERAMQAYAAAAGGPVVDAMKR